MKRSILILILISLCLSAWAQCPTGNISLTSQAQINSFAADYPGCTELPGSLRVEDSNNTITNLNGLSQLTSIGGNLTIRSNPNLYNLSGLNNVTSIGDYFYVRFNDDLGSFSGLNSLTTIGGYMLVQYNASLSSVNGLNNLTSIGGDMDFYRNGVLGSLAAFSNLTSINGSLEIEDNDNLYNLNGLDNIEQEGLSYLRIRNNANLSVCDIESVCTYLAINGGANIFANGSGCNTGAQVAASSNCIAVITCLPDGITFTTQQQIDDFSTDFPLCEYIGGNMLIEDDGTDSISNLDGLTNIISIDGNLQIKNNSSLTDMDGLSNLETINGFLEIDNNDALTVYESWANFDHSALTDLKIYNNANLSLCDIPAICNYLDAGNPSDIQDNAAACADTQAILTACEAIFACPQGYVLFTSQAQIDNFAAQYPNCTELPDNLIVKGNTPFSITNLDGLSQLTSIGNTLRVTDNSALTDFSGLENLTYVDRDIEIKNNQNLTSLAGLSGLTYGRYVEILDNPDLVTLTGLENISTAYSFEIKNH